MPAFAPGQTHVTSTPAIEVDPLPPGTYRFRLVVEDAAGNPSGADEAVVVVYAPQTVTPATPIIREPITTIPEWKRPIRRIVIP